MGPGSTWLAWEQSLLSLGVHGRRVSINSKKDQVRAISGGLFLIMHASVCAHVCVCTHVHVYVITGSLQGLHPSPVDTHGPVAVSHRLSFLWCPVLSSLKESFLLIIARALGTRATLATWGPPPTFTGFSRELPPTRPPIPQIPEGPKSGCK